MSSEVEEELTCLRRRIADLDRQILDLAAQRLETSRLVGEVKRRGGLPIRDFRVEVEVLGRAREQAGRLGLDPGLAEDLVRRLIAAALETQREGSESGNRPEATQRVLVVGGAGRMGSWLCRFFAAQGHRVALSDPGSGDGAFPNLPLREAAPQAEVVVLATPLGQTPALLREVLELAPQALVFDICSLKADVSPVLREAATAGRQVASLHPMFAPEATLLAGRALLVCEVGCPEATRQARDLFADTALGLYEVPLEEHDRLMACLLNLSHAVNLQFALALARSGADFRILGRIASTTFARQIATTAEVAGENPGLYYEIQHFNRHTPEVFDLLAQSLSDLGRAAMAPESAGFESLMAEARDYLRARSEPTSGPLPASMSAHPPSGPASGGRLDLDATPSPLIDFVVPGSKSLTQRALVAAALARGRSILTGALLAEDTSHLIQALGRLGVRIQVDGTTLTVDGVGGRFLPASGTLELGNNGTATRLLLSLAALGQGECTLDGSARLRQRPVGPLVEALRALGARIECLGEAGHLPLRVTGGTLSGGEIVFGDLDSSQYISSLLLVAPCMQSPLTLVLGGRPVSQPYIAMTAAVMAEFGVPVQWDDLNRLQVRPGAYQARDFAVEADASSASYGAAAAVLTGGAVRIPAVRPDSLQGDTRFLDLVASLGSQVDWRPEGVVVTGMPLRAGDLAFDMGAMPDMVPTLAILSAFRRGRTRIGNAAHLRVKESDRLAALAAELLRIGCQVEQTGDGLAIDGRGGQGLHGAWVRTYRDHRIAMAFGLASLVVPGVRILDPDCVAKSFPGYWEQLRRLCDRPAEMAPSSVEA